MVDEKSLTRESTASTPGSRGDADPFDTDIEAMLPGGAPDNCPRKSLGCQRPDAECQVWPGQEHWKRKAKAAKVNRSRCGCMARMSKRNRIIIQVLIGLLIIGIAVGVGLGVSKPLGAGIWKADGTTGPA